MLRFTLLSALTFTTYVVLACIQPNEVYADDARQAQAMEFGIFLGGTASQYDECVKRGLIPRGSKNAEEEADTFFKVSEQFTHDEDGAENARKGWELAKKNIANQPPEYWKNRCGEIASQWSKFEPMMQGAFNQSP